VFVVKTVILGNHRKNCRAYYLSYLFE